MVGTRVAFVCGRPTSSHWRETLSFAVTRDRASIVTGCDMAARFAAAVSPDFRSAPTMGWEDRVRVPSET